jgi:hypothetical protein
MTSAPSFTGQISCHCDGYDYDLRQYVGIDPERVMSVNFHARFETAEAAAAYVATLPKSLGVKSWKGNKIIAFRVSFRQSGVTGSANETGMRRVRRFLELCPVDEAAIDEAHIVNRSTVAILRKFVGA